MAYSKEFRERVMRAVYLLRDANRAVCTNSADAVYAVCAYNSTVLSLSREFCEEWIVFRARHFVHGVLNDGYMDSREGRFNPFRDNKLMPAAA